MLALPLRVAIVGIGTATPSIDITVQLVGKPRTLSRIDRALQVHRVIRYPDGRG